jgi:hypothetical protein
MLTVPSSVRLQVVVKAVTESVDMLGMLMFLLLLSMILFSSLVYFCEKGAVPAGEEVSFLGDAKSSLGDTKSSLGDAKSSLGDAKSSRWVTLRARWVTLRARWVTLRARRVT